MKKAFQLIAYLSALSLMLAIVFRVNHYAGDTALAWIAGLLLSIYFPLNLFLKNYEKEKGKGNAVSVSLAASLFFVCIGSTLKLAHLQLGSLFLLVGLALFCLLSAPLFYIRKSKETNANLFMWGSGILGIVLFPLGIFCKVYLGLEWGMHLFTLGSLLLFVFFVPLYLFDRTLTSEEKEQRRNSLFFPIILGFLLFFLWFKTIYPAKNEMKSLQSNSQEAPVS